MTATATETPTEKFPEIKGWTRTIPRNASGCTRYEKEHAAPELWKVSVVQQPEGWRVGGTANRRAIAHENMDIEIDQFGLKIHPDLKSAIAHAEHLHVYLFRAARRDLHVLFTDLLEKHTEVMDGIKQLSEMEFRADHIAHLGASILHWIVIAAKKNERLFQLAVQIHREGFFDLDNHIQGIKSGKMPELAWRWDVLDDMSEEGAQL